MVQRSQSGTLNSLWVVAFERSVAAGLFFPFFLPKESPRWWTQREGPGGASLTLEECLSMPWLEFPLQETLLETAPEDNNLDRRRPSSRWAAGDEQTFGVLKGGEKTPKCSLMDLLFLFSPPQAFELWFVIARPCFDVIKWSGAFCLKDSFPKLHCCSLSFKRSDQPHSQTSAALTGGCLNWGCPQAVKQNSRLDFLEYLNCTLKKKERERERKPRQSLEKLQLSVD